MTSSSSDLPSPLVLLESAERFAREAGEITLRYFGRRLGFEAKADGSPVTLADREAETRLRERIAERFPGHGVLGEEFGESVGTLPIRWILDPIDGTRSFMRGVPLYGVLIGVEVEGEPVVGVSYFPALDEMVSAASGVGCRWNGSDARVSSTLHLRDAALLTTDPVAFPAGPLEDGWNRLAAACDITRSWGDAYGHALVATGRAEIMVDPVLSPWDAAPFLTILAEAGGMFTDLEGTATVRGGSGISTNGHLHDAVVKTLSGG